MILKLIIFSCFASIVNSFTDAIKFSGIDQTYWLDWWWHILKYAIQLPLWWMTGYYLMLIVNQNGYKYYLDFFHAKKEHFILLGIFILNCIIWQGVYKISRLLLV